MLRKIRVYGKLAKFLKRRVFKADVASAAEAVRFLLANFPQLEPHMNDQYYRVSVGDYSLTLDELQDPAGMQEIKIVPVIAGAGGDGFGIGQIIVGAALIAAAFIPGLNAVVATVFATLGASLVLGGVSTLLTPTPQTPTGPDTEKDPRKSFSFSGIQQTSRQGVPVPIVYGETIVGSVVISVGVDTEKVRV
jgi:predicted phage tail protein